MVNRDIDTNIIVRREIEPVLLKACEVIGSYEQATGSIISVLDEKCGVVEKSRHPRDRYFCGICKKYYPDPGRQWGQEETPCTKMHLDAIASSRELGGAYIYVCPMGFTFWTSPVYSGERLAGCFISSGILAVKHQQVEENFSVISRGKIFLPEIRNALADIPLKNYEEVKILARMMLICAEHISKGTAARNEFIRLPDGRKPHSLKQPRITKNSPEYKKRDLRYSMDKERMLLASLRRGDSETGRKILDELMDSLSRADSHNYAYIQFRAIELMVLLFRAAMSPDAAEDSALLEANNRYLKRIQEAGSVEELTDQLHSIVERLAGQIFSFQGICHASVLRRAERYIWENYTRKISLREIADASGLSAPYFSTVFKEEMGENLSNYLNRLRAEKAAAMLIETDLSLGEISGSCGFEDQSWFSKIFKYYAGMSPGKFREKGGIPKLFAHHPTINV
ncbi:MAG: helix-turn-helix domain-containing protein [Treponema sp.]|nr:helix-turn-helix domain-containing protein [Treponema sp.]